MKVIILVCAFFLYFNNFASAAGPSYKGVDLFTLSVPAGFDEINLPLNGLGPVPAAGGQVVGTVVPLNGFNFPYHAVVWNGTGNNPIDLDPGGSFSASRAIGTDGISQVGSGSSSETLNDHALLWHGTANSAIDLHPTSLVGFNSFNAKSYANAVSGSQQVGLAEGSFLGAHAILWTGAANTAVDLNPSGFIVSEADGTDGTHQVGNGRTELMTDFHALLWSGTAVSAVDLNPGGFQESFAVGVHGNQEVGYAVGGTNFLTHPMLWSGTADSAVDLSPTNINGIFGSQALGTNGAQQVGNGYVGSPSGFSHALLWSGSADSTIDLHELLPGDFDFSFADSIDAKGNVFGIAVHYPAFEYHAVEWVPVPEPSTFALAALSLLGLAVYRRRMIQ